MTALRIINSCTIDHISHKVVISRGGLPGGGSREGPSPRIGPDGCGPGRGTKCGLEHGVGDRIVHIAGGRTGRRITSAEPSAQFVRTTSPRAPASPEPESTSPHPMTLPPAVVEAQWQARFRTLVDLSRDAFVETDGHGTVTEWNRSAELLFGWSRDEVMGRPLDDFLVPARYVRRFVAELSAAHSMVDAERTSPRELSLSHREGHEIRVTSTAYVVGVGDELRVGGFMQEVQEHASTEEALAHAYLHDSLTGLPTRWPRGAPRRAPWP